MNYLRSITTEKRIEFLKEVFKGFEKSEDQIMFIHNLQYDMWTKNVFGKVDLDEIIEDKILLFKLKNEAKTINDNPGSSYMFLKDYLSQHWNHMLIDFDSTYEWSTTTNAGGVVESNKAEMMATYDLYFKKVFFGNKTLVMVDNSITKLVDLRDFYNAQSKHYYVTYTIDLNTNTKKEKKRVLAAEEWFKNTKLYKSVDFFPYSKYSPIHLDEYTINLFEPFVEPKEVESVEPIISFIKDVICSGNDKYFEYLIQWISHIYNRPNDKSGVGIAMILRGAKGVGKSVFAQMLSKLFVESQTYTTNSIDDIVSNFNGALANKILVIGEEALWGGDKKNGARLKDLITGYNMPLKLKFKETTTIRNNMRLLLLTNEDFVPAERDDRRFFCLDVSSKYKKNSAYFKNLVEYYNKNVGSFAKYLEDSFDPDYDFQKNYVKTAGILESIEASQDIVYDFAEYWLESLADVFSVLERNTSHVYDEFCEFAKGKGRYIVAKNVFVRKLMVIFPSLALKRVGRAQVKTFVINNIEQMVVDIEKFIKE